MVFRISNRVALPVSAALAVLAFATIRYRLGDLARYKIRLHVGLAGMVLVLLVALGRPLIPPAPLRVLKTEFGAGIDRRALRIAGPLTSLPARGAAASTRSPRSTPRSACATGSGTAGTRTAA